MNGDNIDSATMIYLNNETKPCPGCQTPIQHSGGCKDMFCTHCYTSFHWDTLRIERERHNPHRTVIMEDVKERTRLIERNAHDIENAIRRERTLMIEAVSLKASLKELYISKLTESISEEEYKVKHKDLIAEIMTNHQKQKKIKDLLQKFNQLDIPTTRKMDQLRDQYEDIISDLLDI